MKNMKAIALLVLALMAGLAAAVYAAGWASQRASIAANKVVVANTDIPLGSRIQPEMLTLLDWPSRALPPGAFTDVQQLQDRVREPVRVAEAKPRAAVRSKPVPVQNGPCVEVIQLESRALSCF